MANLEGLQASSAIFTLLKSWKKNFSFNFVPLCSILTKSDRDILRYTSSPLHAPKEEYS
jgi:hypothetical protein